MKRKQVISLAILGLFTCSFFMIGVLAQSQDVNPFMTTRKEAAAYFVKRAYYDGNGAIKETWGSTTLTLATTYKGLYCLNQLGALTEINTVTTADWIDDHRNNTAGSTQGGYANDTGSSRNQPEMLSTAYSILALSIIDPLSGSARTQSVSFIDSLQNVSGGYQLYDYSEPTLSMTYLALQALSALNDLSGIANVTDWITSTEVTDSNSDGHGSFTTNATLEIFCLYASLEAIGGLYLAGMSPITLLDKAAAVNWIISCQNVDGGFGETPADTISLMSSTKAAILALSYLDSLSSINTASVINWVLSCQKQIYGGFASSPSGTESSVSATYDALRILVTLGQTPLLEQQVPWENVALPVSIIVFILIALAIIGIAVLVIYYRFFK
ncbi:MAG: prenyltransferase/squalene oxidase repeat-containing protein [Candidatus Helarchaeota archaeon]